jgi:hypothetical protein
MLIDITSCYQCPDYEEVHTNKNCEMSLSYGCCKIYPKIMIPNGYISSFFPDKDKELNRGCKHIPNSCPRKQDWKVLSIGKILEYFRNE